MNGLKHYCQKLVSKHKYFFMKHILSLIVAIVSFQSAFTQSTPYHVVFDLTSGDTTTHQRVIRWIAGIHHDYPDTKIEVVFYGKSLPMVQTGKSTVASGIQQFAAGNNVKFAVCEQAMKGQKVEKSMLLPGVTTVPNGIYELITKQSEGFGYIKVID